MPVHISNIGKNSAAVRASVHAGGMKVQVLFRGKRCRAGRAVSPSANHKKTRRGIRVNLVSVAGEVGRIGKGARANIAYSRPLHQVARIGQGYPADLGGAKGNAKVSVVGGPPQD